AEGRGGDPGTTGGPADAGQRGGFPAQDGVDAGGEVRALDGDLPVAFDEGGDDVLAAQSGEQVRSGDAGFRVGAAGGLLATAPVAERYLGIAHLRDEQPCGAARGDRGSPDDLQ